MHTVITRGSYLQTRYLERTLVVGPFDIEVFGPTGDARVTHTESPVAVTFPNAKLALDWVRWSLFAKWSDPVRDAGEWLVAKFRTQIAESRDAGANMTKQGVPPETRLFIAEGA
jgi:hypothetical protein